MRNIKNKLLRAAGEHKHIKSFFILFFLMFSGAAPGYALDMFVQGGLGQSSVFMHEYNQRLKLVNDYYAEDPDIHSYLSFLNTMEAASFSLGLYINSDNALYAALIKFENFKDKEGSYYALYPTGRTARILFEEYDASYLGIGGRRYLYEDIMGLNYYLGLDVGYLWHSGNESVDAAYDTDGLVTYKEGALSSYGALGFNVEAGIELNPLNWIGLYVKAGYRYSRSSIERTYVSHSVPGMSGSTTTDNADYSGFYIGVGITRLFFESDKKKPERDICPEKEDGSPGDEDAD
ncbi:MAG: hypothetical protein ACLFP1_00020 [Candidatus Goldiibacteriota bacterium]